MNKNELFTAPESNFDMRDRPKGRRVAAAMLLLLTAGGLLRFFSARDGLWLDEIWTIRMLFSYGQPVPSATDVLMSLHQENNHYLNSLWVLFLGPDAEGMLYRLPSIVAGTACIPLAWMIGKPRGIPTAAISALIIAFSYPLIHYSSEARGYSLALFCALVCLACQERVIRGRRWPFIPIIACAAIAGVLSQPVFLIFYLAIMVWSAWRMWVLERNPRAFLRNWSSCHLAPLAFIGWLYFTDLRFLVNGGGPIIPIGKVICQSLSLAIGGPESPIAAIVAVMLILPCLITLWRIDNSWCVLAFLGIVLTPALFILLTQRQEVYLRYFLVPIAIFDLTLAFGLARIWGTGNHIYRGICIAVLASIILGNMVHVTRLLNCGRGSYTGLMRVLSQETGADLITIGSDNDFRNEMMLGYYIRFLPSGKKLQYTPRKAWPPGGPEWFLTQSMERGISPPNEIGGPVRSYSLVKFQPFAGLSGWAWALYRKE